MEILAAVIWSNDAERAGYQRRHWWAGSFGVLDHEGSLTEYLIERGDTELVRELLRRGAPVEDRNNDYESTPLSWGIYASVHGWHPDQGDYPGTVEAWLQAGAQPPAANEEFAASEAVRGVLGRKT